MHGVHLLGHGDFSHLSVCRPSPWQSLPSNWGVGELQRRIRVITPAPQVTEQEDQGDQWLQLPSCLTVEMKDAKCYFSPQLWGKTVDTYWHWTPLTALVTLLEVAVSRLHRRALAVVIDAVARAAALLNAPSTGHRTMGPFRPGGPAILSGVARCRESKTRQ